MAEAGTPQRTEAPLLPMDRPRPGRSWATFRTVSALMLREMSTRYGRSPGGYSWAVLEPVGAIIVMAVGFGLMFSSPPLGSDFLLFYATGYLPFSLYQSIANTTARSLSFSKPLLMYPAVTWMDALLARFLLNTLTGFLVTIIIFWGILAVSQTTTILDLPTIALAMGLSALLGLGLGTMNCYLGTRIEVWDIAWSILSRPLFIVSGVFFIYEGVPAAAQKVLYYLPWMHITGLARAGFYPTYRPEYVSVLYVLLWCMLPLCFGLMLLRRYHKDLLNRN
ncbi:MAG: ABC transporter permease [Pseudotabrizicola sp.]|uniref:ABC transporter permease n=1 Tax=Pseudotabrizicola sp. TaxID=2939647 RepID=UPI0027216773|nr:ABC transporter permease [Pseudotabrizicola sp.]MDO9637554.1 ABC transporter permease [Pseudotabrizicola sp.]